MRDYTRKWPVTSFKRPKDVVQAKDRRLVRRATGPVDARHDRGVVHPRHAAGARAARSTRTASVPLGCGGWRVDPVQAELGPSRGDDDVADWLRRARRRTGVVGRHDSRTAYFWGERSWGGPLAGSCYRVRVERGGKVSEAAATAVGRRGQEEGQAAETESPRRRPPRRRRDEPVGAQSGEPRQAGRCHAVATSPTWKRTAAQAVA